MCPLLVTSLRRITPLFHSTIISENWTSRRVTIQKIDVQYMTNMYAIFIPRPVFQICCGNVGIYIIIIETSEYTGMEYNRRTSAVLVRRPSYLRILAPSLPIEMNSGHSLYIGLKTRNYSPCTGRV